MGKMHYLKFIAFIMVSKVRIMVPTRLVACPVEMVIFVLETLPVAFFMISRANLSLASRSESAGMWPQTTCVLVQASGDVLSFLFIECSPCLWHPSSVSVLDSVPGTAPCSAFTQWCSGSFSAIGCG